MSTQNKKLSAHEPQQHTTVTDETASRRPRYLVVSRSGDTLVGADGTLHYLDSPPEDSITDVSLEPKLMKPEARHAIEYRAVYVEDADLAALTQELGALPEGCEVSTAGFWFYPVHADPAGRARYGAALAKRDYLIEMAYSAYTGESAPVDPHKGIRLTGSGEMVFPRIEPAVMALIMSEDNSRVLLANNRLWPRNRFALIAGFVDPGENLEQRDVVCQVLPERLARAARALPELADFKALVDRSRRGIVLSGTAAADAAELLVAMGRRRGLGRLGSLLALADVFLSAPEGQWAQIVSEGYVPSLDDATARRVNEVLAYIEDNLDGELSVGEAAARLAMSPSAFSRFFHTTAGITFSALVRRRRIARACHLLRRTDLPVARIAGLSGYVNLANFNRRFRDETGTTPTGYRRRKRAALDGAAPA